MITKQHIEDFQRDGVVVIRGAFTDWIDTMIAGVDRNMADPSQYASENAVTEGRFFDDYVNWTRIPEYERIVRESPAAQIAAEVMQSDTAQFFHDHVLVKEPGTPQTHAVASGRPLLLCRGRTNRQLLDPRLIRFAKTRCGSSRAATNGTVWSVRSAGLMTATSMMVIRDGPRCPTRMPTPTT